MMKYISKSVLLLAVAIVDLLRNLSAGVIGSRTGRIPLFRPTAAC